jgi:hypothetical protein
VNHTTTTSGQASGEVSAEGMGLFPDCVPSVKHAADVLAETLGLFLGHNDGLRPKRTVRIGAQGDCHAVHSIHNGMSESKNLNRLDCAKVGFIILGQFEFSVSCNAGFVTGM